MTAQPQLLRFDYDRKQCQIGVVHVGVGSFHRAHQALYFDRILGALKDTRWGIVGVNLRSDQSRLVAALANRDNCYVLKTISAAGAIEWREIRSLCAVYDWCVDAAAAAAQLDSKQVKLVTMTVTESGYCTDENGRLDPNHPELRAEIDGEGTAEGITLFGYLRYGLNLRRIGCGDPVTLLCCDNLRHNGRVLQNCLEEYLRLVGDDVLLAWIANHVRFPSCMVDRITPRPNAELGREVETLFQIRDDMSVMAEDYLQWVVEDDFAATRPPLAQVGAEVVADVLPYEEAKIRILNGGHTALVYFAALKGYARFDEAMNDERLRDFFDRFQRTEVLPGLRQGENAPVVIDHEAYVDTICSRFSNQYIADTVERIAMDGVSKFQGFIAPTIRACFVLGVRPQCAIFAIATWVIFMREISAGRLSLNYIEPKLGIVSPLLDESRTQAFTLSVNLWGNLPQEFPEFSVMLLEQIRQTQQQYDAGTL